MRSLLLFIMFAWVILPLNAFAQAMQESNISEDSDAITLWTDDGLQLVLDKQNGSGRRMILEGRVQDYGGASPVRFEEVVEDDRATNLLGEMNAEAWNMPPGSLVAEANGEAGAWLRVAGSESFRPKRRITVDDQEVRPFVLSGYCQARVKGDGFGWWNRHLALNANAVTIGGRALPEQSAYFGQYDHGSQYNKRIICPDQPLSALDIDLSVPAGECTAWYRDIELRPAQYRVVSPDSPLERIDNMVIQEFELEKASLKGVLVYVPTPDHIEVRCEFKSTVAADRAISAYLTVPLDAVGGLWQDHARAARAIEAGPVYRDTRWYGAGRDGYNNRYPFGAVQTASPEAGLAIGVSIAEPRVFQTEYDSVKKELRVRFDLGLSPDCGRWANRGSFTAFLYRYNAKDGFRGAAAKYQQLFDWAFRGKVKHGGTWLPFLSPAFVPGNSEDFHFKFVEATSNMGWEQREGMYSLQYAEPWIAHHEFPSHLNVDEVHGPVVPKASIDVAERIAGQRELPLYMRRQYAAYAGNYIEDKWGEPQGYFFRSEAGRNENMMIVNPNDRLPPANDAFYATWQYEMFRDGIAAARQWHVPGWAPPRTSTHPTFEVDEAVKASGRSSIRFDVIEGHSYYEQHLRGIEQVTYYRGQSAGPFTLSWKARAEHIPPQGSQLAWRVTWYYPDGTSTGDTLALESLGAEWQGSKGALTPREKPVAVRVALRTAGSWVADSTVLWVDDVDLRNDAGESLLGNGGFEEAELLPCRLSGAYLDTMECYEANLNYRRAHWPYAEEPPTFNSARQPALHQIFSHISFARHVAEWFHAQDRIVFANCTPVTPFAAPYLDAMGNELNWKPGGTWTPWADDESNFARFMAGRRPYCLLQYGDLDVDEEARYMKRCLFYGFFPSNQASPSGGWYWSDPVVVERNRPVYARYLPMIQEVADAGWQPLTLVSTNASDIWLERFGEGSTFYVTVFNAGQDSREAEVQLDERVGELTGISVNEMVKREPVSWNSDARTIHVNLEPEDVAVYRFAR